MILVQNDIVFIEYEEELGLVYYERLASDNISIYREAIAKALDFIEGKKNRFWLLNLTHSKRFLYEDQVWLMNKLDARLAQNQDLERVAVIPPQDLYNLMTTESILYHLLRKTNFEFQFFNDVATARDWLEESFREVCFHDEGLTIEYDAYHHCIYTNWLGIQDMASMKRGCNLMLDLLVAKEAKKLLIDNRLALGNWSEAFPWLLQDFIPRVQAYGLQAVAWVLSPSTLHRLNSQDLVQSYESRAQLQLFQDFTAAKHWLKCLLVTNQDQIPFPETGTESQK